MNDASNRIQAIVERLCRSACFRKGEHPDTETLRDLFAARGRPINGGEVPPAMMTGEESIAEMEKQTANGPAGNSTKGTPVFFDPLFPPSMRYGGNGWSG